MTFAVVIIIAVYLPILFLQGLEGRMFRPMAITVCTALFGSLLLALTFVPALASFSFAKGVPRSMADRHARWMTAINARYDRLLTWALDHRGVTLGSAVAVLGGGARVAVLHRHRVHAAARRRRHPRRDEEAAGRLADRLGRDQQADRAAAAARFPEIADVVIKIGRPGLRHRGDGHQRGRHVSAAEADERVDAVSQQGRADRRAGQGPVADSRASPSASRSRWRCAWTKPSRA